MAVLTNLRSWCEDIIEPSVCVYSVDYAAVQASKAHSLSSYKRQVSSSSVARTVGFDLVGRYLGTVTIVRAGFCKIASLLVHENPTGTEALGRT